MRWLLLLVALVFTGTASAFNAPNATFDRISTEAASKPITVWCETDDLDWQQMAGNYWTAGFTLLERPVVYVSPRACWTLHIALQRGYRDAGNEPMAYALLTLLHESVHQRGITNEGEADCTALGMVGDYATRYFGYHKTTKQTRIVLRWRKYHRLRLRVPVAVTASVPNQDYQRLLANALILHRGKGPEYAGNC